MAEEVGLGKLEGVPGKRKLEQDEELPRRNKTVGAFELEDVKMDCSSIANAAIQYDSNRPAHLGSQKKGVSTSSMEVASKTSGVLSGVNQLDNVKGAKIHEEMDLTRSNIHVMWAQMGHDAETVSGLEEKLRERFKELIGTVKKETICQRYYNGSGVRTHPLLVDNVLDKIFEYVCTNYGNKLRGNNAEADIRNARLVCRTWNDRATALMRRTAPTVLFGQGDIGLGNQNRPIKLATAADVLQFLKVMTGSTMIPFQKYSLYGKILKTWYSELLKDLLKIIGPGVVDLKMCFGRDNSGSCYRHFQSFRQNLELLKLRKLGIQIEKLKVESFEDWDGVIHFVKVLLKSASQLKELSLSFEKSPPPRKIKNHCRLPDALKFIPTTVKKLSICAEELTDLHFQALAAANLELKELALSCKELKFTAPGVDKFFEKQGLSRKERKCTATCVGKFFEKQCATLISIELSGKETFELLSNGIPQLRKVEYLVVKEATNICLPLFIVDKFPSVRKLEIDSFPSDSEKPVGSSRAALSVEELCLREVNLASDQQIMSLKECFPNVKILKVWLSSKNEHNKIESVFAHFSQVEELYVNCSHPRVDREAMDADDAYGLVLLTGNLGSASQDHRRKPSLLNLTKLKKLGLWQWRSSIKISDLPAFDILLLMNNLEELTLQSNMSSKVEENLKQKLKRFKLSTTD